MTRAEQYKTCLGDWQEFQAAVLSEQARRSVGRLHRRLTCLGGGRARAGAASAAPAQQACIRQRLFINLCGLSRPATSAVAAYALNL